MALTIIGFLLSCWRRDPRAGRATGTVGNMFEFDRDGPVRRCVLDLGLASRTPLARVTCHLLAAVGNGLAVTVFYVAAAPLVPALHSVWFLIHIVAAAISGAAFTVGGVMSILYLIKLAEERGTVRGYLGQLPDSRRMDLIAYRFLAFAFPLWTFTVAAGAIWAQYAWGRRRGGIRETWALGHLGDLRGVLPARSLSSRLAAAPRRP